MKITPIWIVWTKHTWKMNPLKINNKRASKWIFVKRSESFEKWVIKNIYGNDMKMNESCETNKRITCAKRNDVKNHVWHESRKDTWKRKTWKNQMRKTNESFEMNQCDTNHMWLVRKMNHLNEQVDINESCGGGGDHIK